MLGKDESYIVSLSYGNRYILIEQENIAIKKKLESFHTP
jgi:hypothetical protein